MQSDGLPEYEDLNKSAILDMYNSSQDAKLIASTNKEPENLSLTRDDTSPDLLKQRNPFIKRVSDLTTSPSVLSNGNCRKRGRNLMRIRRTIIDENAIIESKYFSSKDNKECDVESENKEIEVDLKNTKDNTISDVNTNVHDISQEQLERTLSITDIVQNANSMENISDVFLSNQDDCLTNTYRNVPEKSIPNDRIDTISSTTHITDKSYITDNYLVSSSSNMEASNITNYENVNSLQNNLSKCSNTENDQTFSHKLDTFKKQSSVNRVNSDIYIN